MVRIPSPIPRRDQAADQADGGRRVDGGRVMVDERQPVRARAEVRPTETITRPAPTEITPIARPRASGLATFGLLLGAAAAAAVATGVLAFPGVVVGLLGMLVATTGVSATRHAHVAGRMDAMLGLLLSLGAVVVGLLALSDAIPWPNTEADQATLLRDWLDAQLPWMARF